VHTSVDKMFYILKQSVFSSELTSQPIADTPSDAIFISLQDLSNPAYLAVLVLLLLTLLLMMRKSRQVMDNVICDNHRKS